MCPADSFEPGRRRPMRPNAAHVRTGPGDADLGDSRDRDQCLARCTKDLRVVLGDIHAGGALMHNIHGLCPYSVAESPRRKDKERFRNLALVLEATIHCETCL